MNLDDFDFEALHSELKQKFGTRRFHCTELEEYEWEHTEVNVLIKSGLIRIVGSDGPEDCPDMFTVFEMVI
jgi:hypothetical protein